MCPTSFWLFPPVSLWLLCVFDQIVRGSGFPAGSDGKESACSARDPGLTPGSGISPEKETATHSSILAWKIQWMEEPGRLQSMGSQRVRQDWATEHAHMVYCALAWKPTSDFAFISMPGELRKYWDLRVRILSLLLRSQCHNCFLSKPNKVFLEHTQCCEVQNAISPWSQCPH